MANILQVMLVAIVVFEKLAAHEAKLPESRGAGIAIVVEGRTNTHAIRALILAIVLMPISV
jgi:hypothetical protein